MTKQIKNQRTAKEWHEYLVSRAQHLSKRITTQKSSDGFDYLVEEHNGLLKEYIACYNILGHEERESAFRIISQTKQYLHGTLDVLRVRDMRSALEQKAKGANKK